MAIEQLSEELINQIAAGEVIENPSGVIKELIENSIDAGATQIEVDLVSAGVKKIIVKDNGSGISKEDLLKAPMRHATSKIKSFDDLYSITSMGFRGEALASIFSISKAVIKSKHEDGTDAYEISYENTSEVKPSGSTKGTTVVVEDLFYNTPARKKYLKSQNLELKNILDIVVQFCLVYHTKKFVLKNNGKILINKPSFSSEEENIYFILGKELKGNLFRVDSQFEGLAVQGFIANPSTITYSRNKNQFLFVNERTIKSKLVRDAIYEGFSTNLMEGRHPCFILKLTIDPTVVDVNVHPKKLEVKFEDELTVHSIVKDAIANVFSEQEIFKPFETKEQDTSLQNHTQDIKVREIPTFKEERTYYTKDAQTSLDTEDFSIDQTEELQEPVVMNIEDAWTTKEEEYGPLYDVLKEYRILGQVNKTFVILETPKEMVIVDQHVAEEKFYFEHFKDMIEAKKPQSQALLKPEVITLSPQEMLIYSEYENLLLDLGFESEVFGSNEVMIRKVPLGIKGETLSPSLLRDILEEVRVDKKFALLEENTVETLASMSCKKSIKAGYEMTTPEIRKMIENLKRLKEPFNCPHGRPILLQYTFSDLEKKFKRIV